MKQKAYLILEDGSTFEGVTFGASTTTVGELVFTTNMTGYTESLTDPSYAGQMLMYTFPFIGNYGINHEDMESAAVHVRGVVVREFCAHPANFRCECSIDAFLKEHAIPGIAGIDTRRLTQLIRDHGTLNACITTDPEQRAAFTRAGSPEAQKLRAYRVVDSVAHTSCEHAYVATTPTPQAGTLQDACGDPLGRSAADVPRAHCSVALLDYGLKKSIVNSLLKRGCEVTVYPYDTRADTILAAGHDGVMLSNGPGDPADNLFCIEQVAALLGRIPLFGICLGHQMLAIAAGARTVKLKFGHRGANHPVKDLETGRVSITSQNHGYTVDLDSLASCGAKLRYVNVNDGSCEGLDYPCTNLPAQAFSTQFHPEAHAGPHDCAFLFDRFVRMMEGGQHAEG